jgi:hypothetical protein
MIVLGVCLVSFFSFVWSLYQLVLVKYLFFFINLLGSLCSQFGYGNLWTHSRESDRKYSTKCVTWSSDYCNFFLWIWILRRFSIFYDRLTCSMYYLFFLSRIVCIKMFDASWLWQHFRKNYHCINLRYFWRSEVR